MKKIFLLAACAVLFSMSAHARQAFTLVSTEKSTVTFEQLAELERTRTLGKKAAASLTFVEKMVRLVVVTGPADDMLSYRIQGMRNPTLVVPAGAVLKILFVNSDTDMRHDIRFGHTGEDFILSPSILDTAGSEKISPHEGSASMQAEELVIKAADTGVYRYFCSVRSHAVGGMWGNIAVGVRPGVDLQQPVKVEHKHS